MIIDEINRGNISQIFRRANNVAGSRTSAAVRLERGFRCASPTPVGGDSPCKPKPAVIGTMNTGQIRGHRARRRRPQEKIRVRGDDTLTLGWLGRSLPRRREDDPEGLTEEQVELVCRVFERVNAGGSRFRWIRDHRLGHGYFLDAHSMDRLHRGPLP